MKLKHGILLAAAFLLGVAPICSCSISSTPIEKKEEKKADLAELSKTYNGKTWSDMAGDKNGEFYTYFDCVPDLNNLQQYYPDIQELGYQDYSVVWFYSLGNCDGSFKKAYTPIMYKDENRNWQFVKPSDKISSSTKYAYWSSSIDAVYLTRLWLSENAGINSLTAYIVDDEDYDNKSRVSSFYNQYIEPKRNRTLALDVDFKEDTSIQTVSYYDNNNYNGEATTVSRDEATGYYLIPMDECMNLSVNANGYETTYDLNDYVTKFDGQSWNYSTNYSYYYMSGYNGAYLYDKSMDYSMSKYMNQQYSIVTFCMSNIQNTNYDEMTPIVYLNDNGKYEFVKSWNTIDSMNTYAYYDSSMDIQLYSYLTVDTDYLYDSLDIYTCSSISLSNKAEYMSNYGLCDTSRNTYYSSLDDRYMYGDNVYWIWDYNRDEFWVSNEDNISYFAVSLETLGEMDNTTVTYSINDGTEMTATYYNSYYFIPVSDGNHYTLHVRSTDETNNISDFINKFDGYTWSRVSQASKYFDCDATLSSLLDTYEYFNGSKYEMDTTLAWFDEGGCDTSWKHYDSEPIMVLNGTAWEFVHAGDTIDKNKTYSLLSDVISTLFDVDQFYVEFDNNVMEVDIYYFDDNDIKNKFNYSDYGKHVEAKSGRKIALVIKEDDPDSKYYEYQITIGGETALHKNGYYIFSYDGDSRFRFDVSLRKVELDHKTVDFNEYVEAHNGTSFSDLMVSDSSYTVRYEYALYEAYPEFERFRGVDEPILCYLDATTNEISPVIRYTDDGFEFVKATDTIDTDETYGFWTADIERTYEDTYMPLNYTELNVIIMGDNMDMQYQVYKYENNGYDMVIGNTVTYRDGIKLYIMFDDEINYLYVLDNTTGSTIDVVAEEAYVEGLSDVSGMKYFICLENVADGTWKSYTVCIGYEIPRAYVSSSFIDMNYDDFNLYYEDSSSGYVAMDINSNTSFTEETTIYATTTNSSYKFSLDTLDESASISKLEMDWIMNAGLGGYYGVSFTVKPGYAYTLNGENSSCFDMYYTVNDNGFAYEVYYNESTRTNLNSIDGFIRLSSEYMYYIIIATDANVTVETDEGASIALCDETLDYISSEVGSYKAFVAEKGLTYVITLSE